MLLSSAPLGLPEPRVVLDQDGRILNWNEGAERLLGARAPLQGRRLGEFLSGADDRALVGWLAGLLAYEGRSGAPQALTLRCADGGARRVELTSQAMSGKDGFCLVLQPQPEPSAGVLATLEHLPLPAAVLQPLDPADPESLVLLGFNAAARERAGAEGRALVGQRAGQALPLAGEQGWLAQAAAVARGGAPRELDLRSLPSHSPAWPARLRLWPLPERCVGVSPAEAPAQGEDDRRPIFGQILADSPTPALVWALAEGEDDPAALRLVAANAAGEALLGRAAPGQALGEILPQGAPLERWRPLVRAVRERRPLSLSAWSWPTRGGEIRTFQRYCVPLEGRLVAVLHADVTDRRRAEEGLARHTQELAQRNAELASVNQELAFFDHSLSHDLQEALAVIARDAEQVARRCGVTIEAGGLPLLESLARSARRVRELTQRMLAYAALGALPPRREPVPLQALARQALAELGAELAEAGGLVEVGELPMIEADPLEIRQLFQELLSNALKFRGAAPLRVQIGARQEADRWTLWVQDNGRGVPPHLLERLFVPGRNPLGAPGSGLGLAICRKVVEGHRGRIWAEPAPDGTVVRFTLPRQPGALDGWEMIRFPTP